MNKFLDRKSGAMLIAVLVLFFTSACVKEEKKIEPSLETLGKEKSAPSKVDRKKALADYVALAEAYMKQGDREGAMRSIKKGLAIDPDSVEMLNILAAYYDTDGETALAEKEYKRAISANPDHTATYLNYGAFLFDHDRHKEACHYFEKAAADVMYRRRDDAFLNLGKCSKKVGDKQKAEESFRRALMHDPRNSKAQLEMAQVLFDKGDFVESQKMYDQYVQYGRQNPKSLWLGIRLAHVAQDADKEASYALFLKNQFPDSKECAEYLNWKDAN